MTLEIAAWVAKREWRDGGGIGRGVLGELFSVRFGFLKGGLLFD